MSGWWTDELGSDEMKNYHFVRTGLALVVGNRWGVEKMEAVSSDGRKAI